MFTALAGLPTSYNRHIECVINDMNPEVTKKNLLLILICLLFPHDEVFAAEAIIHFWYSARIPQNLLDKVQRKIAPFINKVCERFGDETESKKSKDGKLMWASGTRNVHALLTKEQWLSLQTVWKPELKGPKYATAVASWQEPLRDKLYLPFLENTIYLLKRRGLRVAEMHFRASGILQPFGASADNFSALNP